MVEKIRPRRDGPCVLDASLEKNCRLEFYRTGISEANPSRSVFRR
jgi:hypothetical protein